MGVKFKFRKRISIKYEQDAQKTSQSNLIDGYRKNQRLKERAELKSKTREINLHNETTSANETRMMVHF